MRIRWGEAAEENRRSEVRDREALGVVEGNELSEWNNKDGDRKLLR